MEEVRGWIGPSLVSTLSRKGAWGYAEVMGIVFFFISSPSTISPCFHLGVTVFKLDCNLFSVCRRLPQVL